jgi:hypothetical protein
LSADFDLPFELPAGGIADDNDRVHEPSAAVAGDPGGSGEEPVATPRSGCLIIGPSQAGKTSLLLALEQSCGLPQRGDPPMRFIPDPRTAELMRRAVRMMTNPAESMIATRSAADYGFTLRVAGQSANVVMSDGPGGALFPSETRPAFDGEFDIWQKQLLASARQAETIVLCVDATRPRSDLWQEYLPRFIVGATQPDEAPQAASHTRVLRASRLLILLTKADRLCEGAHVALDSDGGESSAMVGALTPAAMASMLDPVEQLRHVLGVKVLNTLRSALREDASLAVGICSAGGFRPDDGRPYWLANGKPNALGAETREEVLRSWVPFGIRDVLQYIATGRDGGMVRQLYEDELLNDGRYGAELTSVGAHRGSEP